VPEAVAHSQRGARIELRDIPNAEPGMSPLEIWCNEAQERYVLVLRPAASRASRPSRSANAARLP
jgi:phosphoribosylformylglycinamidine synthase